MIRMKNLLTAFSAIVMAGLVGLSSPVLATTPDGETPANEGVCDTLIGATPGLFGLCNAYCEAQDLDSFDKEPPRTKILDNYNKKKQAGDPDMPCIQVPCPCWSDAELASITADTLANSCTRAPLTSTTKTAITIIDNTTNLKFAEANIEAGRERCRYIDLNLSPVTIRSFLIAPADAQACFAQVEQACTDVGL